MTAGIPDTAGLTAAIPARLRALDPAGVYIRYTLYVSVVAALAAASAFFCARLVAPAHEAQYAAVFAGLFTGLTLVFVRPDPKGRRVRTISVLAGGLAPAAALGLALAPYPTLVQIVLVPLAFLGFYVRRWPPPAQNAGMIGTIKYVVIQILLPHTTLPVLMVAAPIALVGVLVGYWFLPHRLFDNGFNAAVRKLRIAVTEALRASLNSSGRLRSSVKDIDRLMAEAAGARMQADQYDPAKSDVRLRTMHDAAVLTRVWENTTEALATALGDKTALPDAVTMSLRASQTAVYDALAAPSPETRQRADYALAQLDSEIGNAIASLTVEQRDNTDLSVYAALNTELTLAHLLSASHALDETLAAAERTRP